MKEAQHKRPAVRAILWFLALVILPIGILLIMMRIRNKE